MSVQQSGQWNDESTLGAPGEDPEYGAGDPERVLALAPASGFKNGDKPWANEEKDFMEDHSITELTLQHHRHTLSESSSSPR